MLWYWFIITYLILKNPIYYPGEARQVPNPPKEPDCKNQTEYNTTKSPGIENVQSNYAADSSLMPYKEVNNTIQPQCYEYCKNNSNCQMAELDKFRHICRLFSDYKIEQNSCCSLYTWKFCNFTQGIATKEQCGGHWNYIERGRYSSKTYTYYSNIFPAKSAQVCQNRCRRNSICGAFNFNFLQNKCLIIKNFVSYELRLIPKKYYLAYQLKCATNQIYPLPKDCRNSKHNCQGRFEIKSNISLSKYLLLEYFTKSYTDCLSNCLRIGLCDSFLYSSIRSHCIVMSNDKRSCSQSHFKPNGPHLYTQFNWKCCKTINDIGNKLTNHKSRESHDCVCINNTNILIKPFHCHSTNLEIFSPNQTCHNALIGCSKGQCFSLLMQWNSSHVNNSSSNRDRFYLVYTGLEAFVIKLFDEHSVLIAPQNSICKLYNSYIEKRIVTPISRYNWHASNIRQYKSDYLSKNSTFKQVVITSHNIRYCFCQTRLSCESQLIAEQQKLLSYNKTDFPYNFIVTSSGHVYEALGWKKVANLKQYLLIAFFGNFQSIPPKMKALKVAKSFIYTGVELGFINNNYVLSTGSDEQISGYEDVKKLYNIVSLWKNYQGRKRPECSMLHYLTLIFNIVQIIFILIVSLIIYKVYYGHSQICVDVLQNLNKASQLREDYVWCDSKRSITVSDNTEMIKRSRCFVQNTLFYWLTSKTQLHTDHNKQCRQTITALLNFYHHTKKPLIFDNVFRNPCLANCSWSTVACFSKVNALQEKNVLLICHFSDSIDISVIQNMIGQFLGKRCLCKRIDMRKLDSKMEIVLNYRKIDNDSMDTKPKFPLATVEEFWKDFNGLYYFSID